MIADSYEWLEMEKKYINFLRYYMLYAVKKLSNKRIVKYNFHFFTSKVMKYHEDENLDGFGCLGF